jgi:hypothetical protein
MDTEQAHDQLVNSRLACVSVSRGRHDAQIYTNEVEKLGEELSRDVSKHSASETGHGTVAPKLSFVYLASVTDSRHFDQ